MNKHKTTWKCFQVRFFTILTISGSIFLTRIVKWTCLGQGSYLGFNGVSWKWSLCVREADEDEEMNVKWRENGKREKCHA
jgi:hypothetical protein